MIEDKYRQFLIEQAHADLIKHSGRTLYKHLVGTHDLLQEWGNDKPVCAAGLFHSIYGTIHFRRDAWPREDRATIQQLIGPHAELMAYVFCVADRPRAFFETIGGRYDGLLKSLREIEAANLIEQGSKSRWLQRLYASDISTAAKLAIAAIQEHAA